MNRVELIGRLGNEPEVTTTNSGGMVAKLSIATDESYTDKQGQKVEKTEWHRVVAFGKLAEIIDKYFEKGKKYFIEGKITTREWETAQGDKRYTTEIVMSQFEFL